MKKLTKIYGKVILVSIPLLIIAGYSYSKYSFEEMSVNKEEVVIEDNTTLSGSKESNKVVSEPIEVLNKSANISELQDGDIIATMTTSKGKIKIKLFPNTAPKTVMNFLVHAQEGYYDNVIFHRVINNFMIQGGDPLGTGVGGESIYGKSFEDEFFGNVSNQAGTIAMANSGPATNGSQFFINEANNSFLDGKHTVFGKVIEGLNIVDKISLVPVDERSNKPSIDIVIEKIELSQYNKTQFNKYEISDIDQAKIDAQAKFDSLSLAVNDKDRTAKSGDAVAVKYELKLSDGKVVDGNFNKDDTLNFTIDQPGIIPTFSDSVKGMITGDKKSVIIEAKDAYGEKNLTLTMADFQQFKDAGITIAKGEVITVAEGVTTTIIDIQGDTIISTNPHQLAGEKLFFEIELKYFVN